MVIRGSMNKTLATELIRQRANDFVPPEDRMRFLEAVETELMGLHRGSLARYRLTPSEFDQWQKSWR